MDEPVIDQAELAVQMRYGKTAAIRRKAARELGKMGGAVTTGTSLLPAKERSAIARNAAIARWSRRS